jgi:hypothetical protein
MFAGQWIENTSSGNKQIDANGIPDNQIKFLFLNGRVQDKANILATIVYT